MKLVSSFTVFATVVGAASAAKDECVCTGGCNTVGDPHVISFTGIQQKVPSGVIDIYQVGDATDSGAEAKLSVVATKYSNGETFVSEVQLNGKTVIDASQCNNKIGDSFPFSYTLPAALNPEGFEEQEIIGYAVCSTKKGQKCKDPANVGNLDRCPVFLNVFMNKTDTILVDSSVANEQDFLSLEQNKVQATGYCMTTEGDSTVNRFTPAAATCECTGPTPPPSEPFNVPTSSPTTSGNNTFAPTNAPTTSGSDTFAPTKAPTTSGSDTSGPTKAPTTSGSNTSGPTVAPSTLTPSPSSSPTSSPTSTVGPSSVPTIPFRVPTAAPTSAAECKCTASCRTWRDPHVSTFDGSNYKTTIPGEILEIYSLGEFSLVAHVTNDTSVYQKSILVNGAEIMNRDECPRPAKSFNDTFTVSGVTHSVTGNVECNEKKGTRFLDVLFDVETDFESNAVQNPSNFIDIEKELGAQGECMDSYNPPSKAPWTCTC